jgi:hypothetical protein
MKNRSKGFRLPINTNPRDCTVHMPGNIEPRDFRCPTNTDQVTTDANEQRPK